MKKSLFIRIILAVSVLSGAASPAMAQSVNIWRGNEVKANWNDVYKMIWGNRLVAAQGCKLTPPVFRKNTILPKAEHTETPQEPKTTFQLPE